MGHGTWNFYHFEDGNWSKIEKKKGGGGKRFEMNHIYLNYNLISSISV